MTSVKSGFYASVWQSRLYENQFNCLGFFCIWTKQCANLSLLKMLQCLIRWWCRSLFYRWRSKKIKCVLILCKLVSLEQTVWLSRAISVAEMRVSYSLTFVLDLSEIEKLTFCLIILEIKLGHNNDSNYNYSNCWAH